MQSPFSARRLPSVSSRVSRPQPCARRGIGDDVGRPVGKDQPCAGDELEVAGLGLLPARRFQRDSMRAPRLRPVAIGDADARSCPARSRASTISAGCDAPRRKEKLVAATGSAKLVMRTPRGDTSRVGLFRAVTARGGTARSGGRAHPPPGNNHASAGLDRTAAVRAASTILPRSVRPFEPPHIMERAPPAEAARRAIGHFGDHLDRLRRIEQMQRAQRRFAAARHAARAPVRTPRPPAGQAASAREYGCRRGSRRTRPRPAGCSAGRSARRPPHPFAGAAFQLELRGGERLDHRHGQGA